MLERQSRMWRRRAIKKIVDCEELLMNPFEQRLEDIVNNFQFLKRNDMYYIINKWEKENKCVIDQRWSYFDKKEKKKLRFGYAEMFIELKLAACLHKNEVIRKLGRLGYKIRYVGKPADSYHYTMGNYEDIRFGLCDLMVMSNKNCDKLENQHCSNCNFFNI